MIKHNLCIFSQNIRQNKILTDTILETQKNSAKYCSYLEAPLVPYPTTPKPY